MILSSSSSLNLFKGSGEICSVSNFSSVAVVGDVTFGEATSSMGGLTRPSEVEDVGGDELSS